MNWDKENRKEDSRALLPKELEAFQGKDKGKPLDVFVKLVKKHKELDLLLRGNSKSSPRISIYRNNHVIFTVYTSGKMIVSFNHARYCENWEDLFKRLTNEYGFNGRIKKNAKGETDIGEISRSLQHNPPLTYDQVSDIYESIISPIFEKYFKAEINKRAVDYFKGNKEVSVSGKTEKRVQQDLYKKFAYRKEGYFFYDLEFAQRHKDKKSQDNDKNNNKPDMLAVKFDYKGKPESLVLVEVKSTKDAMKGTSGIIDHFEKMENYDHIKERRKEACQILNQYALLGLRGLSEKDSFDIRDFENLEMEILLIFTGTAADIWKSDAFRNCRERTRQIKSPDGIEAELYSLL